MSADPKVFADPAIREAIELLREHGVTAEQYATVDLTPVWTVGGQQHSDRQSAFAAAQAAADTSGELVEVWRSWPAADGEAESWIVRPSPTEGAVVTTVDVDRLPPTRQLILEVLAARTRLGHHRWPFDARLRRQLVALQNLGLIQVWNDAEAELTDAGRAAAMHGPYEPPDVLQQRDEAQTQLAAIVRAAERWGGEHYDEILRILTNRETP